jgi:hypothetical protein
MLAISKWIMAVGKQNNSLNKQHIRNLGTLNVVILEREIRFY